MREAAWPQLPCDGAGAGGEIDAHKGWIIDFADLKDAWAPLYTRLDHQFLNEIEGLENPTSERIAEWIATHLKLPAAATLASITVHENCSAAATVYC